MLEIVAKILLTGIFLQASAVTSAGQFFFPNQLPLEGSVKEQAVRPQKKPDSSELGVKITSDNFIVVEPLSGFVIYEKNSREARPIASLTKLMTALVFLKQQISWDKEITMEASDFRPGAKPVLLLGDKVKVKDLFYAMLVASSNEASYALARSTGLSSEEFAKEMNLMARLLSMKDASFVEPSGLSDDNRASAEDVVKLIQTAFSHSEIRKAGSLKQYQTTVIGTDKIRAMESTDKILKEDFGIRDISYKIEAGKTGFTNSAGYCFASQIKDSQNRRLLVVVLNSASIYERFNDTKSLAYWVFNNYLW